MNYQEAIDHIRDEMAQAADHPGVQVLGVYMTERLQRDPALATGITQGKTLAGAFEAIKQDARKHAKGGFAYVAPEQAYAIACGYYGIAPADTRPDTAYQPAPADDALDLDQLLGR